MKTRRSSLVFPVSLLVLLILNTGCAPGKAQVRDTPDDSRYRDGGEFTKIDELGFEDESNTTRDPRVRSNEKFSNERNFSNEKRNDRYREKGVASGNDNSKYSPGENYFQKGAASWYGREFHGKLTASGDKFSMYDYTAAHKTLPFGSYVEVTNLKNGKKVTVKINDRGPYRGNRIIDLSYTAAKQIDMLRTGEVPIGIVIIKRGTEEGRSLARNVGKNRAVEPVVDDEGYREYGRVNVETGNIVIQAGAFFSRRNAENLKSRISRLTERQVTVANDGDLYKVKIKGLSSRREAEQLRGRLAGENIKSFIKD